MKKVIYVTTWHNRIYHNIFENLSSDIDLINITTCENKFLPQAKNYRNVILPVTTTNKLLGVLSYTLRVFSFKYTVELEHKIKTEKPNLLMSNLIYTPMTWQVAKIAKKYNIPFIIQTELKQKPNGLLNKLIYYFFKKKYSKILTTAKHIIPWTLASEKYIKKEFSIKKKHITTLPPGVNTTIFKPHPHANLNKIKLLMIARFIKYKNHSDVLKALTKMNTRNISVDFLGEGALKEKIKKQIKTLKLDNQIKFLKPVLNKKIPKLFSHYTALILPSTNEAIGMVVPEAMACGLPVIVSNTVGATTYLTHDKEGLIYPTHNISKLIETINKLKNTQKIQSIQLESIKKINTKYTNKKVGLTYSTIIKKIIKGAY